MAHKHTRKKAPHRLLQNVMGKFNRNTTENAENPLKSRQHYKTKKHEKVLF